MVWKFTVKRLFQSENSTASSMETPSGAAICCLAEPGPKDRLPAGTYRLAVNPVGWYARDVEFAKKYDPLGYRGMPTIGDRDVLILPSTDTPGPGAVVAGWHVVHNGIGYVVPPDGFADGQNHGDAFAWLFHNLYLAADNGGAVVQFIDPP
jgi:hypothetical protein